MTQKRFEPKELNREDHAKIDRAAEHIRNHFPWLVRIIKMVVKN